jgi:hypothetical protein
LPQFVGHVDARYELAMKIDGRQMRSIWVKSDGASVGVIDQTLLPHRFATIRLTTQSLRMQS